MGRIHPDAENTYFRKHLEEREIVRPFLSCFDVTRAFRRQDGRGEVAAYYLAPERFISELLGVDREILLVYSPYEKFQARTVQLHDTILAEDRVRLDPVGSIIVSDSPNVRNELHDIVGSEPERPPILALPTSMLARLKQADHIRSLFVEGFFSRDLFALESPLRSDISFFGRQDIVAELLDRFRSGQNSGLFGLRRIGKTSVLYALRRRVIEGGLGGVIYLDLSNPAIYRGRWWHVLESMAQVLVESSSLTKTQRSKLHVGASTYTESNAAAFFKGDLETIRARFPKSRVLLEFDEIEQITFGLSPAQHWTDDFLPLWQTLRSMHQDTQGDVCYVVAGVNPHPLEADRVGRFDNPLFSTAKPYFLAPFDAATVREMVRRLARYMGLRCEETLYVKLTGEYGGHPFLVRQACSHLAKRIEKRPETLTVQLFNQEKRHIALALERNVRQILNVLAIWYPNELELLTQLAGGDVTTFKEFAGDSAEFTQHVEGYGLVRSPRYEPQITIGLVETVLLKTAKEVANEQTPVDDPDAVRAEISRRRNAIEIRLREVLRDGLRYRYGGKSAGQLLKCFADERRTTLTPFSYDDIWSHLYFNELGTVIDREWAAFQAWFSEDKDKVLMWIDEINRSRSVDAHAGRIDDEALVMLRMCFRRLETRLQRS